MPTLDIASAQILGARAQQQDGFSTLVWPSGFTLGLLADGMGGAVAGEIASELVLRAFADTFTTSTEPELAQRLAQSLAQADGAIADYIVQHPEASGMGSTLLAVAFSGSHLDWLSVGDSPLWLYRNQSLIRLNQEHAVRATLREQLQAGLITAQAFAEHPQRNQLTSAVMGEGVALVDINDCAVFAGDILLLASDGLETLSTEQLTQVCQRLSTAPAEAIAQHLMALVSAANKPHQDNTSLIVMKIME